MFFPPHFRICFQQPTPAKLSTKKMANLVGRAAKLALRQAIQSGELRGREANSDDFHGPSLKRTVRFPPLSKAFVE